MMIKKILLFLILSLSTFALKSPDVDMNVSVKVGEKREKKFTLINDKSYPLRYKLSIANGSGAESVTPTTLLIPAFEKKDFQVSVIGKSKGEKKYKLILEEDALNLNQGGSSAKIKMKYRIEQKYVVE